MAQGRCSATRIAVAMLLLLASAELATAALYTVGGTMGWTFNTVKWPVGKRFRAGDVLLFKYNPLIHNVVNVTSSKWAYTNCRTPRGSRVYKTGADKIKLVKGNNYFICNFPGHCQANMKIAIYAA